MMFPERLLEGYRTFRENRFPLENNRLRLLAKAGQRPKIMLVSCCDSRAAPEVIFDAAPGEIFVLRNVANLVPPYYPDSDHHGTSAALEFAVLALKIQHIVVMGHEKCGGVKAAWDIMLGQAEPLSHGDFIGNWMAMLAPLAIAVREDANVPDDMKNVELEHRAVQLSLENLMTFPWIKSAVAAGELALHGAWFDIANGALHVLNETDGKFETV